MNCVQIGENPVGFRLSLGTVFVDVYPEAFLSLASMVEAHKARLAERLSDQLV